MTVWAGCYARDARQPIPRSLIDALGRALSRAPRETIHEVGSERCMILVAEVAYKAGSSTRSDAAGTVTCVAGDPLPDGVTPGPGDRARAINLLHDAWARGAWEVTSTCQGTFCGVHYSAPTHTLALIADKVAVRPVYYATTGDYVFFSGAQRVLESLSELPKALDVRGLVELATLGYALGARTPYSNIAALRSGEIVGASDGRLWQRRYWRWDGVPLELERDEDAVARDVYERFSQAVADRRRGDRVAAAFLSGGLDSRAIVAELRRALVRTYTFNFASRQTQDQEFAAAFAKVSGADHKQLPLPPGPPRWSLLMSEAWAAVRRSGIDAGGMAEPQVVWSGDGGSVGLGHVYMTPGMVELLRAGDRAGAIEAFTRAHRFHVARRLWHADVWASVGEVVRTGIEDELSDIRCEDRGRDLHVFLLANDQRRHLAAHFEDLDLHRLEFHVPFFDGRLLQSIVAAPLDLCLRHRLYNRMLTHFGPAVFAVPWQAYDGHEPCPVPAPVPLVRQWSRAQLRANARAERRTLVEQVSAMLSSDFPHGLLNRRFVRTATWIHRLGIRDYAYALKAAASVHRPWRVANGTEAAPSRREGV
jgi:hypothetical protein